MSWGTALCPVCKRSHRTEKGVFVEHLDTIGRRCLMGSEPVPRDELAVVA